VVGYARYRPSSWAEALVLTTTPELRGDGRRGGEDK